ncbi:SusC/RagA family TonB-linked outer membrane protein [Parafilimonas terrae]|uniref:TonB-linked outer membrane protein, SusC/RagA family n=1 Tax=Parafilimonas terrae TaxID=1465490 RepID=A0A1I5Z351_9BACT|nr:SusC/RagA family TonB-linked outer membrane protein [Parafilimonas terrae]SFQ50745.1 TonB-linked outer membrane protein, SusC/RagA family [Parafilimonas terrae]
MRKTVSMLIMVLLTSVAAWSQGKISGTVKDQNGDPVPFATVNVKGTKVTVAADVNANFTIPAKSGDVLVITAVGVDPLEITVGNNPVVTATVNRTSGTITDVVVTTALGIRRNRNELPYAAQTVTSEEMTKTNNSNFANSMSGKVSGLQIKTNNSLGGSTNIILRGARSITGDNQALIVIDGVPVNNSTYNSSSTQQGFAGYDYGNQGSDINPEDIASVNVLKGAAASALYGSRAANGVILITTKKGKSGLGITLNLGASTGNMDKSTWIKYQRQYGSGYYDPDYYTYSDAPPSPDSHFWYLDANGDGVEDLVVPTTEDASFGAKFDPNLKVYQWTAFDPTSPTYLQATPWVAAKHDPTAFFQNPVSAVASLIVQGGDDKFTYKLGYSHNDDKGILPNSKLKKDIVNFQADYKITDKLTITGATNFSKISGLGRYGSGYDAFNLATNFREWWQMNVDVMDQKAAYERTHKNITWNMTDPPNDIGPIYWDNPYYVRYESFETDSRYRYISYITLNYAVNNWLNLMGRVSLDTYENLQEERNGYESINIGAYSKYNNSYKEYNYDFLASVNKNISDNLNFKAVVGTNLRRNYFKSTFAITNGGLIIPGIYDLANSANPIEAPTEEDQQREIGRVFGGITLAYKEMLILDLTASRDQSSTLPKGNNAYFYPSASGGFVFSKLLPDATWLNFGKLRLNYAEVGADAPFDYLVDNYTQPTPFGTVPLFSVNSTKKNADLKPEKTRSYEAGIEASFLKNRIGFDVTYYHTNTIDQIIPVTISGATGYTTQIINAGVVENKGIEASLNLIPVKTKDFSWNMALNWTNPKNKVVSLTGGTENILMGSFQGGVTLNAVVGQPMGVLKGSDYIYTDGQKTVDGDGYYEVSSTTNNIIGNIQPKWYGGINNTFTYKGISLSFLIDMKQGGDLYSVDQWYGQGTGLTANTAGLNDKGNPIRDAVEDGGGIKFPGVTEDGKPNGTYALITGLRGYGYNSFPNAGYIYDASYVKLREASISYSLPSKLISKLNPIKGIDISVYGRNLWIIHKNMPDSDPEEGPSAGNIQGFQVGSYPTYRMIGLNLNFKF